MKKLLFCALSLLVFLEVPVARCASCPEWPCHTNTNCGGSIAGCTCVKQGHDALGVCMSLGAP